MKKTITLALALTISFLGFSQEDEPAKSNILEYTPSKLLNNGDWDFKIFNNLYTQTKFADKDGDVVKGQNRDNFFTTTLETYTGVSENARINVGLIANIKSNTFNKSATSVFGFGNNLEDSRSGLTSIAPSIKIQPFGSISNFSLQTSLHIPLFKDQPKSYLDKRSYVWETKFFFDKTFGGDKFQVFTELDFAYNFGEKSIDADADENSGERFANNSIGVPVSAFLSYFPSDKFTVYINAQHYKLFDSGNKFEQDYTLAGFGAKYQLTDALNIETSYGNFLRGTSTGLGQTFNLGLRYLLKK